MFSFLTAENENYSAVLEEPDLLLADKVSFSLQYLSDEALVKCLKRHWQDLRLKGDLRALILCGMGEETIGLLQRFLDRTGKPKFISPRNETENGISFGQH